MLLHRGTVLVGLNHPQGLTTVTVQPVEMHQDILKDNILFFCGGYKFPFFWWDEEFSVSMLKLCAVFAKLEVRYPASLF